LSQAAVPGPLVVGERHRATSPADRGAGSAWRSPRNGSPTSARQRASLFHGQGRAAPGPRFPSRSIPARGPGSGLPGPRVPRTLMLSRAWARAVQHALDLFPSASRQQRACAVSEFQETVRATGLADDLLQALGLFRLENLGQPLLRGCRLVARRSASEFRSALTFSACFSKAASSPAPPPGPEQEEPGDPARRPARPTGWPSDSGATTRLRFPVAQSPLEDRQGVRLGARPRPAIRPPGPSPGPVRLRLRGRRCVAR